MGRKMEKSIFKHHLEVPCILLPLYVLPVLDTVCYIIILFESVDVHVNFLVTFSSESVDKSAPNGIASYPEKAEDSTKRRGLKRSLLVLILVAACVASFEPLFTRKRDYCLRDCSLMPGKCEEVNEEFVCVCLDGYTGNHISGCEDIDECVTGKLSFSYVYCVILNFLNLSKRRT